MAELHDAINTAIFHKVDVGSSGNKEKSILDQLSPGSTRTAPGAIVLSGHLVTNGLEGSADLVEEPLPGQAAAKGIHQKTAEKLKINIEWWKYNKSPPAIPIIIYPAGIIDFTNSRSCGISGFKLRDTLNIIHHNNSNRTKKYLDHLPCNFWRCLR